jgi:hypothetical protein
MQSHLAQTPPARKRTGIGGRPFSEAKIRYPSGAQHKVGDFAPSVAGKADPHLPLPRHDAVDDGFQEKGIKSSIFATTAFSWLAWEIGSSNPRAFSSPWDASG